MNKGLVHYMFQLVDELGKAITSGAAIVVNIAGSTDATIYSDANGTALTNPITSTVFAALANNTVSFWYGGPSVDLDIVHSSGVHTFVSGLSPSDARVVVDTNRGRQVELLYANVAVSAEHENTTDAANFDKTYTLDGSALKAGDVIHIKAVVDVLDNNSTDTLTLLLTFGTETLWSSGAVDVADNDVGYVEMDVHIMTTGATGTIMGSGIGCLGVPGTIVPAPFIKDESTEDISGDIVIAVNADWSVGHADDECRLATLEVTRKLNAA